MATTASQRQAAYRARRPLAGKDGNGERRLSVWIDTGAFLALGRLARRYSVTKRALIEKLLIAEDQRILARIDPDSAQWQAYFGIVPLRGNGKRPSSDDPPTATTEEAPQT